MVLQVVEGLHHDAVRPREMQWRGHPEVLQMVVDHIFVLAIVEGVVVVVLRGIAEGVSDLGQTTSKNEGAVEQGDT